MVRTTPAPLDFDLSSPASMRSTIRWTTSRGVKCSPGFSSNASLNLRISSSKIVPIAGVVDVVWMEIHCPESFQHLKQKARFFEAY